jgi:hypothetical protein
LARQVQGSLGLLFGLGTLWGAVGEESLRGMDGAVLTTGPRGCGRGLGGSCAGGRHAGGLNPAKVIPAMPGHLEGVSNLQLSWRISRCTGSIQVPAGRIGGASLSWQPKGEL